MTAPQRPCSICGKECAPADRNTDGTFTHYDCSRAVTQAAGWNRPGHLLPSRAPEEEEPDGA